MVSFAAAQSAPAQSRNAMLALGPDRVGEIKTALGITTRITFPEPVTAVICGDLYDAGSGRGTFVIQPLDPQHPNNEVFIKPVASKGVSNMFVRTGDGKHTYSFDLKVVSAAEAHYVVNITDLAPASN